MPSARLIAAFALVLGFAVTGCDREPSAVAVDPTDGDDVAMGMATATAVPAAPAPSAADRTPRVIEGDGFTITFPTVPSIETVDVPLDGGVATEATIYQAQIDGGYVGFSFADTPDVPQAAEFDEERALRDSAQGAADNTGGTVEAATIIDVQGRTGIDYRVAVEDGVISGIAFFDGTRLYTGQQVAQEDTDPRGLLDDLMATLVLTDG